MKLEKIVMKYRYLGNSGLRVSAISLGSWLTHKSDLDLTNLRNIFNKALELGITTFDTADVYGNGVAEEVLGKFISVVDRSSIELFSKVYWRVDNTTNGSGLSRKHIMESIDKSLLRLKTDYLDLYQAHRYDYTTPLEETMGAFMDVVRSGKALYIGVSEWTAEQIKKAKVLADQMNIPLISSQPQYSILYRVPEKEVMPTSSKLGIGQIVWSPLAQGLLTGKYSSNGNIKFPVKSRLSNKLKKGVDNLFGIEINEDLFSKLSTFADYANSLSLTPSQLALLWCLNNENVSSVIVGATKISQIIDNARAGIIDFKMSKEILNRIDEIFKGHIADDPKLTKSPENRP